MGRRIAVVVFGMVIAVLGVVGIGASVAVAACPNEAFRTGPSAQLAECRAYEQVTPVDKESGIGVTEFGVPLVSPSGDRVFYSSTSAFAHPEGNPYFSPYVSTRADGAWSTRNVGGRQGTKLFLMFHVAFAASEDLGLVLIGSEEALTPGAIASGSNLYLLNSQTGELSLVVALPKGDAYKREWANLGGSSPLIDGSRDWSSMLFSTKRAFSPEGVEGEQSLYEFREGRMHLAVAEATPAGNTEATPNVMSADGRRFFYVKNGLLYLHQLGGETLLVSEDEAGAQISGAAFLGATPDGGIAFFLGNEAVYRFEAAAPPGRRITDVTPPGREGEAAQVKSAAVGEDGTTVYLGAKGLLTPDAQPRTKIATEFFNGVDFYVWHGAPGQAGGLRYFGKTEIPVEFNGFATFSVSTDGRYFGFESKGEITPDVAEGPAAACPSNLLPEETAGHCTNVFLYSYDANRIVCASCGSSPPVGESRIGGKEERQVGTISAPRAVTDDGSIFFDTANALLPRDANGVLDVYGRHGDETQLISTGVSPAPSSFIDASVDGSNVFFGTEQSLVGQDVDTSIDLYDARVDGGLDQGLVTTTPCSSETSCRTGIAGSSPSANPVSAAADGGGACLAVANRAREAKRRSRALARQAKKADGRRAKALRSHSLREAKLGRQLGRKAGNCTGGGR